MKIDQLRAIVTGGASGLGAACARMLAAGGADVFIADIDDDRGREIAAKISANFVRTDVCSEDDIEALFAKIEQGGDPARILVNCAGVAPRLPLLRDGNAVSLDVLEHILRTNITGTILAITRFIARLAVAQKVGEEKGVIVNTSSITAYDGQAGHSIYAATKGAIASMTLPLARELASEKIRTVAIAPGTFDTPMMSGAKRGEYDLGSQTPHPTRLGRPQEFADLVHHIVKNPMLNGEVIRLDGALRMTPS